MPLTLGDVGQGANCEIGDVERPARCARGSGIEVVSLGCRRFLAGAGVICFIVDFSRMNRWMKQAIRRSN